MSPSSSESSPGASASDSSPVPSSVAPHPDVIPGTDQGPSTVGTHNKELLSAPRMAAPQSNTMNVGDPIVPPTAGTGLEDPPEASPQLHATHPVSGQSGSRLLMASLTALGVVYGDIGTSPLYALRECFHGEHAVAVTPGNVYGILSLVFWALIIVVTIKYLVFILRADNNGEGGILALTALGTTIGTMSKTERHWLVVCGLFGAALLYGDGMITPAISVLSAVEGLNVATTRFESYVLPITIAIILGLFAIQRFGTEQVGKLFGPVMVIWFSVIALLGVVNLYGQPQILMSFNPYYAWKFFLENHWHGMLVLGSVVLVITGGEAMYADMGHFGARPIRAAWFTVVLPSLLLNYLGQGALLLQNPNAASNPFYRLAPEWALYPLVILSTVSAIIASQALISGAFSLTMQAAQLGFLPRLHIKHTSSFEFGQIYMPTVNWVLMAGCILIVVGFRSSSSLAAAYGIAVTATMVITTVLFAVVARNRWHWAPWAIWPLTAFFLIPDLAFFFANVIKIPQGGWFPICVAIMIFTIMTTWKRGRQIVWMRLSEIAVSLPRFLNDREAVLAERGMKLPTTVPGTAIFMTSNFEMTPPALLQNIHHNKVLHENVVLLTVKTVQTPHVPRSERVSMEPLGPGFYRVQIAYGFMEDPNIPKALNQLKTAKTGVDLKKGTYFLGREWILTSRSNGGMQAWRETLFAIMSRSAASAASYFCLPPERTVELGSPIEI